MKESTILVLFAIVSPFVPFLLVGLSLIQPIYAYAQQVALSSVATSAGRQGMFVMDISNLARAQLIHGLFAGFMSGVMFAIAVVKWIDQRKTDKSMNMSASVPSAQVN